MNKINSSYLKETFADKFLLFFIMFANTKSFSEIIKAKIENKSVTSFPSVNIASWIYLLIFGTSCEGERSFSKLKLIKNLIAVNDGTRTIFYFALLSIENDLMREMSFENVIYDFSHAKSRKVYIILYFVYNNLTKTVSNYKSDRF